MSLSLILTPSIANNVTLYGNTTISGNLVVTGITTIENVNITNTTIVTSDMIMAPVVNTQIINSGTSNTLTLQSNNATALTIDTSQNLLVGTLSRINSGAFSFLTNASGTYTNNGMAIQDSANGSGFQYLSFNGSSGTQIGNITRSGTNNAIQISASSYLAFAPNFTEAMRLDTSGNLGLGVTPSAVTNTYQTFQIGNLGNALTGYKASPIVRLDNNCYISGGVSTYAVSGYKATSLQLYNGTAQFSVSSDATQTAGSPITFTQAMTLNNSGTLVFAQSGQGIQFTNSSATTNSTLNDYETGTWTPTYTFSGSAGTLTYSTQNGTYTKIGNTITLTCLCVVSNKGTASGYFSLALPFNSKSGSYYAAAALTWNSITYGSSSYIISSQIGGGTATLNFYNEPSGGSKTNVDVSQCGTSFEIIFSVTYVGTF